MKVLCVHGVGDHRTDDGWKARWSAAIRGGLRAAGARAEPEIAFLLHDHLFARRKVGLADAIRAAMKLLASGVRHGIGDLLRRPRGIFDLSPRLRWTAGMVVQWVEDRALREETRRLLLAELRTRRPDLLLAHSLGSLIAYDALTQDDGRRALGNGLFCSFGSQIGNPFIRSSLGGRIAPLDCGRWIHLWNRHDDAFAAPIRLASDRFEQVATHFDIEGILDHDAVRYLSHPDAADTLWRAAAAGGLKARALRHPPARAARPPDRRALLVGINRYPREAMRLEGCVNDVFTMSSVLQECGYGAEEIRVVLDERATAKGILERLSWLLDGARDGDERFFYYSGHGAQIPSYGADEEVDRVDECLVPWDFDWSPDTAITDDALFELYSQIPYGARFAMALDCCHSGGMSRDGGPRLRGVAPPDDIRHRALRWDRKHQMWVERRLRKVSPSLSEKPEPERWVGAAGSTRRLGRAANLRQLSPARFAAERKRRGHLGPYLPVVLQACRESELSYEYRHGVEAHGAFTYALALVLRRRGWPVSWTRLVRDVATQLRGIGYDQHPEVLGPRKVLRGSVPWRPGT
jgi:hypothetical protein